MNNLNYEELIEINEGSKEQEHLYLQKDIMLDWIIEHQDYIVKKLSDIH